MLSCQRGNLDVLDVWGLFSSSLRVDGAGAGAGGFLVYDREGDRYGRDRHQEDDEQREGPQHDVDRECTTTPFHWVTPHYDPHCAAASTSKKATT